MKYCNTSELEVSKILWIVLLLDLNVLKMNMKRRMLPSAVLRTVDFSTWTAFISTGIVSKTNSRSSRLNYQQHHVELLNIWA